MSDKGEVPQCDPVSPWLSPWNPNNAKGDEFATSLLLLWLTFKSMIKAYYKTWPINGFLNRMGQAYIQVNIYYIEIEAELV